MIDTSQKIGYSITEAQEAERERSRSFVRFVAVFLIVFAFIAATRTFVYFSVQVDGASMENTLKNGDLLIVDRTRPLSRGEVVVFKVKGLVAGETDEDKMYIKRIIGMPGDTVWTENGYVCVSFTENGERKTVTLDEPYAKDLTYKDPYSYSKKEDLPAVTVPEGSYFVMGDNRRHSSDSRIFGVVDKSFIRGVVPSYVVENKDGKFIKFITRFV